MRKKKEFVYLGPPTSEQMERILKSIREETVEEIDRRLEENRRGIESTLARGLNQHGPPANRDAPELQPAETNSEQPAEGCGR